MTVSNVTFTGATVAGGTFSGGLADGLGIDSGVMLSSGDIANGIGPNDQDGAGTCNKTPGDADLDAILRQKGATEDAAVLEFDFVPATSNVSFRYVFASEEYNEFVGCSTTSSRSSSTGRTSRSFQVLRRRCPSTRST